MRIAILGGAFDPPHLGHFLVAKQTLDFAKFDEVWLMPCFSHPFDKKTVIPEHRLEMCHLSINNFGDKRIRVSDFEIRLKTKSFTLDTIKTLKKTFKTDKFYWLIGSDNLETFKKWHEWKELLSEAKFLVFPRIDYKVKKLPKGFSLIESKNLVYSNISSEIIRKRLKKGLSVEGMIDKGVEEYIIKNNLYK